MSPQNIGVDLMETLPCGSAGFLQVTFSGLCRGSGSLPPLPPQTSGENIAPAARTCSFWGDPGGITKGMKSPNWKLLTRKGQREQPQTPAPEEKLPALT